MRYARRKHVIIREKFFRTSYNEKVFGSMNTLVVGWDDDDDDDKDSWIAADREREMMRQLVRTTVSWCLELDDVLFLFQGSDICFL